MYDARAADLDALAGSQKPTPVERRRVRGATLDAWTSTVRERIRDTSGRSWPDPSASWWSAMLGRTRGPWWRELVVE